MGWEWVRTASFEASVVVLNRVFVCHGVGADASTCAANECIGC